MTTQHFGANTTFGEMTSELLKLYGDRAVPLKQHAGMFLGAVALPKTKDAPHDDSFDYKLKLLTYDNERTERFVRVISRANPAGYLAVANRVEFLNPDHTVRHAVALGTDEVTEESFMPEIRELANDALHFQEVQRLEAHLNGIAR